MDGSGPSTVTRDDSGTPTVTNDAVDGSLLTDIGFGQVTAAFDTTDGDREWRVNGTALGDGSTSVQTAGGLTFLSVDRDDDSRVAGVDPSDGTIRWTYAEGSGERFVRTGATITDDIVVGLEFGSTCRNQENVAVKPLYAVVMSVETVIPHAG